MDYLFLDVANTLLHKPKLWDKIHTCFLKKGIEIPLEYIKKQHKLCSELIKFPDKTSAEFYTSFNKEFLLSMGIIPSEELLSEIFSSCTYLEWEAFEDLHFINECKLPKGIISNWDKSLETKLKNYTDINFSPIIGSEGLGICKPNFQIFEKAREEAKCTFAEMIFIGDSIKLDIEPALKLGIRAILLDRDNIYPYYNNEKINSFSQLRDII